MVEIMTILLSVVFLMPMPILPLHILFLNLVINIAPAMALSFEPDEDNIMKEPPRDAKESLISRGFLTQILISGTVIGLSSFLIFIFFQKQSSELNYAQSATFTFMAVAQLMHVWNVRKENAFGLLSMAKENKQLLGALGISFVLQLAAIYIPWLNHVLGTKPLAITTWLVILAAGSVTTGIVYFVKKIFKIK